ncbi:MAG: hypothetical protein HQ570_01735 [Candidatus Omnitrophica bacterium]|nr:hypothetical protein [Candidatus Omnitrophota bacterium]
MRIEFSLFIAIILSGWLLFAFLLEYVNNRRNYLIKKGMQLEKRKCEVCASVYFVSIFFEFWNCPLCGSINKER